jgi:hypothetical protein
MSKELFPLDFCEKNYHKFVASTHEVEYFFESEEVDVYGATLGWWHRVEVTIGNKVYKRRYFQDCEDFCRYCFHNAYLSLVRGLGIEPLGLG